MKSAQAALKILKLASVYDSTDPTMRNVLVTESYIKSDYDGDGVAEFRRVLTVGERISYS
jgi:hypothetical protein